MERNGNRSVCFKKHMVLLPDKVGTGDLVKLLHTGDAKESKAVDCEGHVCLEWIAHRWMIFISIIIQKFLLALTKPMAWIGSTIEEWLNLMASTDRGFSATLFNYLLEGTSLPDPKSKDYRSFLALADDRVRLDENIRPEDGRYLGALTIMASKLVYENPARIENTVRQYWNGMEFLEVLQCSNDYCGNQYSISSQAFLFSDKSVDQSETIVVAFRGTQPFDMVQWCIDCDFSWYEHEEAGKIHEGFMRALGLQSNGTWPEDLDQVEHKSHFLYYTVREKLKKLLRDRPDAKFVVTGHSLGGAIAILFPVILMLHGEDWMLERLKAVHTFGQPRVGDRKLGEFVQPRLGSKFKRFVYNDDIVPRLPFDNQIFGYKHFGTCYFFNIFYQGIRLQDLPNKNYYSFSFDFITMHITAAYELCRSFFIGYLKGPAYREGWLSRGFRTVGLFMPGAADHVLTGYVNSTRLGVFDEFW